MRVKCVNLNGDYKEIIEKTQGLNVFTVS